MTFPRRLMERFGIDLPILQAPMAGAQGVDLAVAVAEAGGLGALPCALVSVDTALANAQAFRARTKRPLNLNFFCHTPIDAESPEVQAKLVAWRAHLRPYFVEAGLDPDMAVPVSTRAPFDDAYCAMAEAVRPEVVSFHFGLPVPDLLARVKATGAAIISSATTVEEAIWLGERGIDAVIAMGVEAGGHRATFLDMDMSRQVGTFALVPQIVDAIDVPVIAAGGIADGRGIAAAMALGAEAVQIGTAYLFTPEATISTAHRQALAEVASDGTALTNLFTGRPARGIINQLMREIGPMSDLAPPFPLAGGALVPLKATPDGPRDFSNLWAGQAAALSRMAPAMGAGDLTRWLADGARRELSLHS